MSWLSRALFGPPDACDHCWHTRDRTDCRAVTDTNKATRCCKCGEEVPALRRRA